MSSKLTATLTPELLREVREFWFEHIPSEDNLILLRLEHAKRWFQGGKELDDICVQKFAPALEAIKASGATSSREVLDAFKPSSPLDWLSLLLLLDQMPRNCYRGPDAALVFTFYDPIAEGVAREAIARGIPDEAPEIRWRIAYRQWFYLPLMHSEDLAAHELAVAGYARLSADVDLLCSSSSSATPAGQGDDEHRARAAKVLSGNEETARAMARINMEFEKKHLDIIKKFGRYPHRNEALGREMTAEEKDYLESGGETFSGSS